MTRLLNRRTEILSIVLLLATTCGLGYLMRAWQLDVSFINYRYIENLQAGLGFIYSGDQSVLLASASPPYVTLVAGVHRLISELVLASNVISITAVGLGAVALYFIVHPASAWAALTSALLFLLFPVTWFSLGTDVSLWLALALMAVWFQRAGWSLLTGVALALAILVRPEAAVLSAALLAEALVTGRDFRPAPLIVFGVLLGIGVVAGFTTFDVGGPLAAFNGLSGPSVATGNLFAGLGAMSYLWLLAPALSIVGLVSLIDFELEQRWVLVVAGWGGLHLLTVILLPTSLGLFSLLPLYIAFCVLAGLGVAWIAQLLAPQPKRKTPLPNNKRYLYAACLAIPLLLTVGAGAQSWWIVLTQDHPAVVTLLPAQPNSDAADVGQWITANSPEGTQIAVAELGTLTYFIRRPLLDYQGRLQPDLADAYVRQDGSWWLGSYTPDYVVLHASDVAQLGTYQPGEDPWFSGVYGTAASFGDYRVYQRIVPIEPLRQEIVGVVEFPDGYSLTGQIGTDVALDPLEADTLGRVQLNWLLTEPIDEQQHVAIRIEARGETGGVVAINGRDIDFSNWSQRRFYDTYHTLQVSPVLQPGVYDVAVGIGPDPFNLEWQTITQAKVPFPEANIIGGFSGTRAEFGDIILLGYRLARPEDDLLDVSLNWQAAERPLADYQVVLQVRGEDGTILARLETEPHSGAYPTSVWSAGERVPDVYTLDIRELPAGDYNVYAGLVDANGERLLTLDGQESIFVGRVNITE